jgi:hypothetical protein
MEGDVLADGKGNAGVVVDLDANGADAMDEAEGELVAREAPGCVSGVACSIDDTPNHVICPLITICDALEIMLAASGILLIRASSGGGGRGDAAGAVNVVGAGRGTRVDRCGRGGRGRVPLTKLGGETGTVATTVGYSVLVEGDAVCTGPAVGRGGRPGIEVKSILSG